jgi:hypothetical protein
MGRGYQLSWRTDLEGIMAQWGIIHCAMGGASRLVGSTWMDRDPPPVENLDADRRVHQPPSHHLHHPLSPSPVRT